MDTDFWNEKWVKNEIGFHETRPNPLLVDYWGSLGLAPRSRVFVPLCGKTLDMHWLLENGHRVVGVELSRLAIEQLFAELGRSPTIEKSGVFERFSSDNLVVFVGDVFSLSEREIGAVDGIYDRAALVALPETVRSRYATHLMEITNRAPQLLITFEYDQTVMIGPPFSVSEEEVVERYGNAYEIAQLTCQKVAGGLKGRCPATERVWGMRGRSIAG